MQILQSVVEEDLELFIFDFRSHGMSEGEAISYGFNEADDIAAVIDFINIKYLYYFMSK